MIATNWMILAVLAGTVGAHTTAPSRAISDQTKRELLEALANDPRAVAELQRLVARDPTTDYEPYSVACPTGVTWVRPATSLSSGEQAYIQQRQQYVSAAVNTMMGSHGLPNPPRPPVIGIALSGGGYRAMTSGLGGVMATNNGSSEAAASGVGGWFEALTYMTGLSGGSWGTGSFMANDGILPTDLVNNVWDLDSNLILPSDDQLSFYGDLVAETTSKKSEGFPVQITDLWALALGNHLLPTQYRLDTTPNLTFSQLPSLIPVLQNASVPMPIIVAAEREDGQTVVAENATVWEFTPYEFGSWAVGSNTKTTGAFTPLEYLGSSLNNAQPNGTCYKGFDQLSFIMGTSSTLFNGALLDLNSTSTTGILVSFVKDILSDLSDADADVSRIPNSFANWTAQTNPISTNQYITLVDCGETNQNIPLEPLLQQERNVDAIIALDNSADTPLSWPNGTAMYTTYQRAKQLAQQQNVALRMPAVPSENGFVNGQFNARPTFFGCNDTTTPLIVYVPEYPWSFNANLSTFQLAYDNETATQVVLNGMRSLTLNGSVPSWPQCLACALTDRSFGYTSANRTQQCQSCFNTWCWDGTDDTTTPPDYTPTVGTVPSWLTSKNLVASGAAAATSSAVASSSGGSALSSASTSSKSGSARPVMGSSVGLVACALGTSSLAFVIGGLRTIL